MSTSIGDSVGDYKLVRRLGRGGMAEVWAARRSVTEHVHKHVAIKLMAPHIAEDPRYTKMFRSEAGVATLLSHANIVQVFEFGEHEGRSYLVMEWVDGINLLKLRGALKSMDEERRFRIAAYVLEQLLHALRYAHNMNTHDGKAVGIVHRDVTPQNVIVSNHGEVKLTDFGVASHAFNETSGVHVKGKIRYMAPEHITGKSRDKGVDLYGAGAIFHELLTGDQFRQEHQNDRDLYLQVLEGTIPEVDCDIPAGLDAIRLGLLDPDPLTRIPSADHALDRLCEIPRHGDPRRELMQLCGGLTGILQPRSGPGVPSPTPRRPPVPAGPAKQPTGAKSSVVAASPVKPASALHRPSTSMAEPGGLDVSRTEPLPASSPTSVKETPGAQPPTHKHVFVPPDDPTTAAASPSALAPSRTHPASPIPTTEPTPLAPQPFGANHPPPGPSVAVLLPSALAPISTSAGQHAAVPHALPPSVTPFPSGSHLGMVPYGSGESAEIEATEASREGSSTTTLAHVSRTGATSSSAGSRIAILVLTALLVMISTSMVTVLALGERRVDPSDAAAVVPGSSVPSSSSVPSEPESGPPEVEPPPLLQVPARSAEPEVEPGSKTPNSAPPEPIPPAAPTNTVPVPDPAAATPSPVETSPTPKSKAVPASRIPDKPTSTRTPRPRPDPKKIARVRFVVKGEEPAQVWWTGTSKKRTIEKPTTLSLPVGTVTVQWRFTNNESDEAPFQMILGEGEQWNVILQSDGKAKRVKLQG